MRRTGEADHWQARGEPVEGELDTRKHCAPAAELVVR